MGRTLSKGQGQVKYGHQKKILHECRATHVVCDIWDAEFDVDICPEERSMSGQAKSN